MKNTHTYVSEKNLFSKNTTFNLVKLAVSSCGSKTTSFSPQNWNKNNPLLGHCTIVALVVQDFYRGSLLRASLKDTAFEYMHSHYWNRLPNGKEIDLTENQFLGQKPRLIGKVRTRKHIISNQETLNRYHLFKSKVIKKLNELDN